MKEKRSVRMESESSFIAVFVVQGFHILEPRHLMNSPLFLLDVGPAKSLRVCGSAFKISQVSHFGACSWKF